MQEPRLHRSIVGDGISLAEQDPAAEQTMRQLLAGLRCGCEPDGRIQVGENMVVCTRCWRERRPL